MILEPSNCICPNQEIYAAVYRCSVCNEEAFNYDYCPNCGAKMDGGEA